MTKVELCFYLNDLAFEKVLNGKYELSFCNTESILGKKAFDLLILIGRNITVIDEDNIKEIKMLLKNLKLFTNIENDYYYKVVDIMKENNKPINFKHLYCFYMLSNFLLVIT